MTLIFGRRALRQLEDLLAFIAKDSPPGAERVRARIRASTEMLLEFPLMGQITELKGIRRLVVLPYPYLVFYRLNGDKITVLAVRHAARMPLRG